MSLPIWKVAFGHLAHFLLVDGIGRGRDGASGGDGQRDVTVMALAEPHPGQPGHGAQAHLMIDATGSEYAFAAPTGDWLADLLDIGEQARAVMRRHPWLPSLLITRSVLGPNGLVLLEHVLQALAAHPASLAAKLEAFAIFNTTTALFVQNELGGGSARQQRNAAYLNHALATGRHPRLAELLAPASPAQVSPAEAAAAGPADRYRDILARILSGLLGPESADISRRPGPVTSGER